ncbi:hypothetical protein M083_0109 [Bacteroides fragilis str. 3986 T(B)9]|uniref:Uncharacterized protein n=9 Tax=Bacteroides fragilis TaxID=817 RepID=A0A015VBZ8_BACFG|nr:hypothetical protein HMPREF0101_02101 [Bacteroides fragilis]EXY11139.1 hypothetical protein M101_4197 [Bacteroides fragilis str. 1007-1-F \
MKKLRLFYDVVISNNLFYFFFMFHVTQKKTEAVSNGLF